MSRKSISLKFKLLNTDTNQLRTQMITHEANMKRLKEYLVKYELKGSVKL